MDPNVSSKQEVNPNITLGKQKSSAQKPHHRKKNEKTIEKKQPNWALKPKYKKLSEILIF
jgi:hypothetical protein